MRNFLGYLVFRYEIYLLCCCFLFWLREPTIATHVRERLDCTPYYLFFLGRCAIVA